MASNARNLSKLLGTSTQVPTTALPPAIADLETVGETLSGGEIAPSSIKSNTLTQSFDSNQAVTFNMADSIDAVSPIVSVFKEVPQAGFSSKGQWDVNANATNYDFYDEKPISYSSVNLTPSATGDGTFTSSNPITTVFDLSSSSAYTNVFTPTRQQTSIGGATQIWYLKFKSDGTKMYHFSPQEDSYYQYSLSTAWDISSATYEAEWDMTAISGFVFPGGMAWKSDGTKIYWYGRDAAARFIRQHALTTAWDISTVSDTIEATSITSPWSNQSGIVYGGLTISPDGTKWYSGGANTSSNDIEIATFATAWGITSSITNSSSSNLAGTVEAIDFNSDGTQYLESQTDGVVRRYTLSTAYDLTTRGAATQTIDLTTFLASFTTIRSMTVSADRTKLYVGSDSVYKILEIDIGNILAFNSADVGKKVVGNSGSAVITGTSGTYKSVTPFADTSAISSWQLFGAQGKSDGSGIELSGYENTYDLSNASYTTISPLLAQSEGYEYMHFKPDGTKVWIGGPNQDTIYEYDLSTGFDLSTISYGRSFAFSTSSQSQGFFMKSDGTRAYISNYTGTIYQLDLSTAWNISSASYSNVTLSLGHYTKDIYIKPDGTKLYNVANNNEMKQFTMSTPWDLSTATLEHTVTLADSFTYGSITFNSDGTILFIAHVNTSPAALRAVNSYSLSTAWDISSTLTLITNYDIFPQIGGHIASGIGFNANGSKMYIISAENTSTSPGRRILEYYTGSFLHTYSTYSPALTNSSTGQINSSSWLDINSMTADETKNGGDIFYAVSTDNRTSWGVAKASDGVRKIVKNNSGTWQYNNDGGTLEGFDYTNATTTGDTLTVDVSNVGIAGGSNQGIIFSGDGTKFYLVYQATSSNSRIYQVTLGTAWDLTSGTTKYTFNPSVTQISAGSIGFNQNGTALYIAWRAHPGTARYFKKFTLSTAWDLSTASGGVNSANLNSSGDFETCRGLTVGLNEEFIVTTDYAASDDHLAKFTFATAGDVTSSITKSESTNVTSYTNFPPVGSGNTQLSIAGPQFFDNGNKLFFMNYNYGGDAYIVNLTSAYDITSGTLGSTTGDISGAGTWMAYGVKPDGTRLYIFDHNSSSLIEYSTGNINYGTSETWVNGTNNNEHATLQQALTSQAFNRMNKAQLDAVADGYHFSQDSADTLDLMIAPYAASGTSPISDGVTINYDAAALIREAIPGTDYIADFPNPTTLNITAVGAANLKIRAQ